MSRVSRILFAVAAVLLAGVFVFPLWSVHLNAPQYPEGLGMQIHISDVHGIQPQDLQNINELNHYIGMKPIVADAIPELKLMPKILAGLMIAGLLVAIVGKRALGWVWVGAFVALGAVGMVDFYKWEYDYGHHLDFEHAIIKIPGMSYQPPLIGSKQLLNFTATSWPGLGAYLMGLSIALAVVALVFLHSKADMTEKRALEAREPTQASVEGGAGSARVKFRRLFAFGIALVAAACGRSGPEPIAYGDADCASCSMRITDKRFGAEVVTKTGKVHQFDAVECLASYYAKAQSGEKGGAIKAVYVTDFRKPGTLIPVEQAVFVRGDKSGQRSPMGMDFFAYGADAEAALRREGNVLLRWPDVVRIVEQAGMDHGSMRMSSMTDSTDRLAHADTAGAAKRITVSPNGPLKSLGAALALADSGSRIVVMPGVYREPTIRVEKSVSIVGQGRAVLDGEGQRPIMVVLANGVSVRGLTFSNVGTSYVEDRAALRLAGVSNCVIEDNHIDHAFFGIYLARVEDCRIARNVVRGEQGTEEGSGNGIHLWSSRQITITDNDVSGERDGIYFEFVRDSRVQRNVSTGNLRYGLHFMFSDSCRYEDNVFRDNGAGVAVMFTKHVEMIGNRFEHNWGAAAYGLLLKEIYDARLENNRFDHNTTGLVADGANRIDAVHNDFVDNGWALKLFASTQDGAFTGNNFIGNTFDVATNSEANNTTRFAGNYWSDYAGYDLNHDGTGDVPFHPVRLFSMIVEQNAPTTILLRSMFVGLLDTAERVFPSLTPETLVDDTPAMRRLK